MIIICLRVQSKERVFSIEKFYNANVVLLNCGFVVTMNFHGLV